MQQKIKVFLLFISFYMHTAIKCMKDLESCINICRTIKFLEKQEFIRYRNQKHKNASEEMNRFMRKLQILQKNSENENELLYQKIQTAFSIPKIIWNEINTIVDLSKKVENERLHLPIEGVVHDKAMPYNIKKMLKRLLNDNGINPKRIHLQQYPTAGSISVPYGADCSLPLWEIDNYEVAFDAELSKPGIISFPVHANKSHHYVQAECIIYTVMIKKQCSAYIDPIFSLAHTLHTTEELLVNNISIVNYRLYQNVYCSLHAMVQSYTSACLLHKYWKQTTLSLSTDDTYRYYGWIIKAKRYMDSMMWLQQYCLPKHITPASNSVDQNNEKQ